MADAPGPLALIDIASFNLAPSPPAFGPLAGEFSAAVAPHHPIVAHAFDTLTLEASLDVGGALDGDLDELVNTAPIAGEPYDSASLETAKANFHAASTQLITLGRALPPEAANGDQIIVEQPATPGDDTPPTVSPGPI